MISDDLRTIIQRVRITPPTCISHAAPRLDPPDQVRDAEQFTTHFWLGCSCGSRQTAVLCFPTKVRSDIVNLAPLALQCATCNKITEIFDPDRHGYDAEVSGDSAATGGSGQRQTFRCSACGHSTGEPIASFAFNDPEGFKILPSQLAGREQDTFDFFALELRCAACGKIDHVVDYECA
jgi:hypothetical protein